MKNIKFLLFLLLTRAGAVCYAQESVHDTSIVIKNGKVMPAYFALKNNLLVSDSVKTVDAALNFANELPHVHLRAHRLDELMSLKKLRTKIVGEAQLIAATKNINKQREHFAVLSKDLWTLASAYKFATANIYYDRCTMTGVTWMSEQNEIANPYYPKNMRTCGVVEGKFVL